MIVLYIAAALLALVTVVPVVHMLIVGRPVSTELVLSLLRFEFNLRFTLARRRRPLAYFSFTIARLEGWALGVDSGYKPWSREDVAMYELQRRLARGEGSPQDLADYLQAQLGSEVMIIEDAPPRAHPFEI